MKKKSARTVSACVQTRSSAPARNAAMARAAASTWLRAEEHGLPTHGMSRVPFYCAMLKNGRADGSAHRPRRSGRRRRVCLIDNADGLPYESCAWAIAEVIQRARRNGIGFAGVTEQRARRRARHSPAGGRRKRAWSASRSPIRRRRFRPGAARRRCSAPIRSRSRFPRRDADPIVVDLALTTVVRGKIMMAMQKGEKIPEGWALDRDGKPTTDPKEAIERGSLFPIGGAKGAMLALAFELDLRRAHRRGDRSRSGFVLLRAGQQAAHRARPSSRSIPARSPGATRYFERVETVVTTMLADEGVRLPGSKRFASGRSARRTRASRSPDDLLAKIERLAHG